MNLIYCVVHCGSSVFPLASSDFLLLLALRSCRQALSRLPSPFVPAVALISRLQELMSHDQKAFIFLEVYIDQVKRKVISENSFVEEVHRFLKRNNIALCDNDSTVESLARLLSQQGQAAPEGTMPVNDSTAFNERTPSSTGRPPNAEHGFAFNPSFASLSLEAPGADGSLFNVSSLGGTGESASTTSSTARTSKESKLEYSSTSNATEGAEGADSARERLARSERGHRNQPTVASISSVPSTSPARSNVSNLESGEPPRKR